jgi:hypothetical protein
MNKTKVKQERANFSTIQPQPVGKPDDRILLPDERNIASKGSSYHYHLEETATHGQHHQGLPLTKHPPVL